LKDHEKLPDATFRQNTARKRALIESVLDELKNICQIEHTRHISHEGFIINLLSGLIAYSYLPKKPSLNLEITDQSMDLY
jgi:hypothetical protein